MKIDKLTAVCSTSMLVAGFGRFTMMGIRFPEDTFFPIPAGAFMILTAYFIWKEKMWSYFIAMLMMLTVPISMWYNYKNLSGVNYLKINSSIFFDEFAVWICLFSAVALIYKKRNSMFYQTEKS